MELFQLLQGCYNDLNSFAMDAGLDLGVPIY
jgi:hypothetical protein